MDECRVLFLSAARRKKQEGELRCFSPVGSGMMVMVRPSCRLAEVIDLDQVRAAAKPRRDE